MTAGVLDQDRCATNIANYWPGAWLPPVQSVSLVLVNAHRYHAVILWTPLVTTLPQQTQRGFVAFWYTGEGRPERLNLQIWNQLWEWNVLKTSLCKQGTQFQVKTVTCCTCAAPSLRLHLIAPSAGVAGSPAWCLKAFCIKNSHEILFIADRAEPWGPFVWQIHILWQPWCLSFFGKSGHMVLIGYKNLH